MIKLLITDVDGTLTDGGLYYGSDGTEYKRFSVLDGFGIVSVREKGVETVIITGRKSYCVTQRAEDLGIKYVFQNIADKADKLKNVITEMGLSYEETAYFGDDLNDIEAMMLCAVKGCPVNAISKVKSVCDFVAKSTGVNGALREYIEWLEVQNHF